MKTRVGTRVKAASTSLHSGQTGLVVADYGSMLLVKADDESYAKAYKSLGKEGKYFQVDSLLAKQLKD